MALRIRPGMVAVALALALAGCSEQIERMPEQMGGLPADAPGRPKAQYEYPAVHDIPPPRAVKPMSESEVLKLERELKAARDRQQKAAGQNPATPAPANTGKPAQP